LTPFRAIVLCLPLLACKETEGSIGPISLIVKSNGGEKELALGNFDVTSCAIRRNDTEVSLSETDCIALMMISEMKADHEELKASIDRRIAALEGKQELLSNVAAEVTAIAIGSAQLVTAVNVNGEAIDKELQDMSMRQAGMNAELSAFIAQLIEQYRVLAERIDKSVPNYVE
jgi:hypothetical protein